MGKCQQNGTGAHSAHECTLNGLLSGGERGLSSKMCSLQHSLMERVEGFSKIESSGNDRALDWRINTYTSKCLHCWCRCCCCCCCDQTKTKQSNTCSMCRHTRIPKRAFRPEWRSVKMRVWSASEREKWQTISSSNCCRHPDVRLLILSLLSLSFFLLLPLSRHRFDSVPQFNRRDQRQWLWVGATVMLWIPNPHVRLSSVLVRPSDRSVDNWSAIKTVANVNYLADDDDYVHY